MEDKEIKILIFSINGEYYATDIMEVERILNYEVPTKLPDAPNFIEGVINYQDNILPIVSLTKKFGFSYDGVIENSKIIVVKQNLNKIGIIVDVVSEVKDINLKDVENAPDIAAKISQRYIKGLIKLDKEIIIFLNLSAILTEEEQKLIK